MADIKQIMEMLFPAYAGVIPEATSRDLNASAFPRIRGGDPDTEKVWEGKPHFSPHTRG